MDAGSAVRSGPRRAFSPDAPHEPNQHVLESGQGAHDRQPAAIARRMGRQAGASPWSAAVMIAGFGVVYALVALFALRAFPFSGDEYATYLQAELFARGLLHAPAPAHPELLRVDHVILDGWVR